MDKSFVEDIVADVRSDYENRSIERKQFEAQWQLNSNFALGNQFSVIRPTGEVEDSERSYFWQEREVYNHIASILETRLAKLSRVRPKMSVRPASGDEDDIRTAKVATKILDSACLNMEFDSMLSHATMWSELTGSVFYKITWDEKGGKKVGFDEKEEVHEGDVRIEVCPSFEIFPDNLSAENIEKCNSIIHTRAMHREEVYSIWKKKVKGEETDVLGYESVGMAGGLNMASAIPKLDRSKRKDYVVVIERYTRPSEAHPEGETAIVAGEELLYYGPLPYINGKDGERDLPFVKQDCIRHAGCFFGTSMVERCIPIQRAYNAVKNRKHEFMNRIAMGVLAVEDGSVDMDNLEEEGLSPGKILVYRQGSNPPALLNPGSIPTEFSREEDRLLSEFITVSGVSEIMRSSSVPSSVSSGIALQLLLEQDDTRLAVTAENIKTAARKVAMQILRLYKQFACQVRLDRIVGKDGDVELVSWKGSDISCDDVAFVSENELNSTPASNRTMLFDLLHAGLLYDENGRLSENMRYKILDVMGYGGWEHTYDKRRQHIRRAQKENILKDKDKLSISEFDEHTVHFDEHRHYLLSPDGEKMTDVNKRKLIDHMREHLKMQSLIGEAEGGKNGAE